MGEIIQIEGATKSLNKEQVDFNKKLLLIEKRNRELEALKERLDIGRRIAIKHLLPLEQKQLALTKKSIRLLDQHHDSRFFKKKEKEKIVFLIREALRPFIWNGTLDDELLVIEEKYFPSEGKAEAAAWLNEVYGFEMSAKDLSDLSKVRERMKAAQTNHEPDEWHKHTNQFEKKVSQDEVSMQESVKIGKTVKQIYTDLVKLLHPDREQDEEKVAQKTEWMKAITRANQEKNFFGLLHFHQQFMAEKNRQLMHQLDDAQLNYYNKLLTDQLKALKSETKRLKNQPVARLALKLVNGSEAAQRNWLQQQIRALGLAIQEQQGILDEASDKERLRRYLKQVNVQFLMSQQMKDFPFPLL